MAAFMIAEGQTLRMDKMVGNHPVSVFALLEFRGGTIAWRRENSANDPHTNLYAMRSTDVVFSPPFSDPDDYAQLLLHDLGDITLDMQFFDPAFGTLTRTTWTDVTLFE
jgi:hypothetical protein